MSKTHWKKAFNPKYLGSFSLEPGQELTLTIAKTQNEDVTDPGGKVEECFVCHWQEEELPLILNKTNCKNIEAALGTPYREDWVGGKVTVYIDPKVEAFGSIVEAIRIRPYAPVNKPSLSAAQFSRMQKAIEKGDLKREDALKNYSLTQAQIEALV